jgi:hypothetical protein
MIIRTRHEVLPTPAPSPPSPPEAAISPVRTVEIRPPSNRDETIAVVRAAAVVLCIAAAYILSARPSRHSLSLEPGRPPYQRLFADLQPAEQRMFRELQEAILEAENTRLASARWPAVSELAGAGVAPFAPLPGHRPASTEWALHRDGLVVNYLGLPRQTGQPAYLVLILEPDPALVHGAIPVDEEHQRLADGTILHVTVWMRREPPTDRDRVIAVPPAEGWLQLVNGMPPSAATSNNSGRS